MRVYRNGVTEQFDMKTIDIYDETYSEKHTKVREACRGIVVSDGKILLTYETNTGQWFIPGGGVETNESHEECCVREVAEETGYIVEIKEQYLKINEHYNEWLWVSYYYICDHIGITERKLTEREVEEGLELRWISLEEAVEIFSKYQDYEKVDKMKYGAYLREYTALREYFS